VKSSDFMSDLDRGIDSKRYSNTGMHYRLFVLIKEQQSALSDMHSNHETNKRIGLLLYAIYSL